MELERLVDTARAVQESRGRKAKAALLAALFRELYGADLALGLAFLVGELPAGKIGVGAALLREVGTALPPAAASSGLTLCEVDDRLRAVGAESGAGSKARRREALVELFGRATEAERGFLFRLLFGELRQGAQEGVLLEGIAEAAELPVARLRRAAMLGGSVRAVGEVALTEGAAGLERFRLEVGRPVLPMLARTAPSPSAVIEERGEVAFEWKLDGVRIQVHRDGGKVRAFTRRLHEVTASVPEVVELALALPGERFVLDGEVLAFGDDGRPRPFQETMGRFGRRLDVERERRRLPLSPVFFDLLAVEDEPYIDHPGRERWTALEALVPAEHRVRRTVTGDAEEAEAFYAEALARGHEGLVAKDLEATYEAGRRGKRWWKVKPAHPLDLVVLAAEWGSGRREGRLSNLHLGARTADGFCMLGKTFKGMTDEVLAAQTEELLALEVRREGHVVHVRPERVVEIAFDGLQESPQYPGGLALRFARLKRHRPDKAAAEADTLETVTKLHEEARGRA